MKKKEEFKIPFIKRSKRSRVDTLYRLIFVLVILFNILVIASLNHQTVELIFDPFSSPGNERLILLPLYQIIYGAILVGGILGGFAAWSIARQFSQAGTRNHLQDVQTPYWEVAGSQAKEAVPAEQALQKSALETTADKAHTLPKREGGVISRRSPD